ncbi:MAG: tetratricopeptide repeat protein [Gammaproteobacteria bacterium]
MKPRSNPGMRRADLARPRNPLLWAACLGAALCGGAYIPAAPGQQTPDAFLSATDISDLIAEGRKRISGGDPQGALQEFEEALARDPENPQVLYFLGNLYLQLQQPELGLKYLARSVELAPENFRVRMVLAKAYERFGNLNDAMREYQKVISVAPDSREAQEAGERNRALAEQTRITSTAVAVSPAEIAALVAEATRLRADGDLASALVLLKSVLVHEPGNVEILIRAGEIHLALEQPVPGIKYLERAAKLAPERYALRMRLADLYEQHDVLGAAYREYRAIAAAAPGTPEGVEAARREPQLAGKIQERLKAETIPDRTIEDLSAEGRKLLADQDPQGALRAFKGVLALQPTNLEVLFYVGTLLQQLGQPVAGIKYLEFAVTLAPDVPLTQMTLAQGYERYGAVEDALQAYESVIKQSPATAVGIEAQEHARVLTGRQRVLGDDAIVLSADIDTLVAEGKRLLSQGDPQGALRMLSAVLTREPDNKEVLLLAASIFLQQDRTQEGLPYLARSVELDPGNYQLRLSLAQAYQRVGLMGDALGHYQKVADAAPGTPEAVEANKRMRLLTGLRHLSEGEAEQALEIFTAVLTQYPNDPAAFGEAITALSQADRVADAQAMLDKVIAAAPREILPYVVAADVSAGANDYPKAIARYEQALALAPPGSPQARNISISLVKIRGHQALQSESFAAAKDLFEEQLSLVPGDRATRLNLATAYRGMKDTAKAEEILLDMLKQQPADLEVRLRLGALYLEMKQPQDAAREFEEIKIRGRGTPLAGQVDQLLKDIYAGEQGAEIKTAIQDEMIKDWRDQLADKPDDLQAWSQLALLSLQLNRREQAIEAFENIVRINPDNLAAQETLGGMYDESGALDKAQDLYKGMLEKELGPDERTGIEDKLALLTAKKAFNEGRVAEAETGFKQIIEKHPDDLMSHFYLAIIYSDKERPEDASRQYEEVIRIAPNHAAAHLNLGLSYEQSNREEDALDEYRAAMRLSPSESLRDSAAARVKALENRIDGFSYSINYSTSYSSNNNLTRDDPEPEYRTDLSGSINYRRKLYLRPVYLGLVYSPSYSTYYNSQFDLFNTSITPYLTFAWKDLDFSASFTGSMLEGLATESKINETYSFNSDVAGNIRIPALIPWLASDAMREEAPGSWRLTFGARKFESATSPILNSLNLSFGATLSQTLGNSWRWSGGYTLTSNENADNFSSDQAYVSHGLALQLSKVVAPGLSVNGGYNFSLADYVNPDSATLFTEFRRNFTHNLSTGATYFVSSKLRLFANLSWQLNESNLPTGFILSPEDVGTAVGIQSSSLGDYMNVSLSAGAGLSF